MEASNISFIIRANYGVLPSPKNLNQWYGEDPTCALCPTPGTLKHILTGCKTSLTQGHYTWRHNQVFKNLAAALESKWNTTNSLPLRATNPITAPTFIREGQKKPNHPPPKPDAGQLAKARYWKMLVDIGHQLIFPPEFAATTLRPDMVYRYSYNASYIIYNLHTREVWEVSPPEVQNAVLQHAAWGKHGQQLLYVFENNLYYQADLRASTFRVTSSGAHEVIFNGLADWLYEEEILKSHLAYWWSPDGERLAFLTINDTLVPNMALPQFTGSTYPQGLHYPYPMAGQVNPSVRLSVVSLFGTNTHTQELVPPEGFRTRDLYVSMVKWISSTHLAVRWLRRSQNASVLAVCDATTCSCIQRHQETSEAWLTMQDRVPWFSRDRSRLFLTLPVKQGGQGDFQHISMLIKKSRSDQNEVRHLTSGDWEVTRILAYDESNQIIYFLSTEDSPQHRHMYSVSTLGLFPRRCLTCGLGQGCTFFDADVSPDSQHAILRCKGPGVPSLLLLIFADVPSYFILEDNLPLRSALESRQRVQSETKMISHDHFELAVRLTYPSDFSTSYLYGLLLMVESPPGGQGVSDEFRLGFDWLLASSEQVVVARVDGRGSGFRGQRLLHQIHQKLGTVDVQDQLAALEYLGKLPYIDRRRVGIYGQGYGGYVALEMLKAAGPDQPVHCAAVQAPVIDWSMYASAFSERYLGPPSREDQVYQASQVLPNLRSSPSGGLLLAHGTADANVHFQHSAELIKRLIRIGANYSMQIYPDEGHFLSPGSQLQLTQCLIGYFKGCLLDSSP
ncbi:inactive dipeptidyl peptidase 10-like [Gadus macrocephalus]|uniref:inactive dipeptidyl peptidase 10-like n=1 Tax=Gadus macrocephalus TaxID=80720 RepID=UPI0028CBA5D3|nr:inactive dipeptidyl peptidase 10-like [Gadus macrocephalus]